MVHIQENRQHKKQASYINTYMTNYKEDVIVQNMHTKCCKYFLWIFEFTIMKSSMKSTKIDEPQILARFTV